MTIISTRKKDIIQLKKRYQCLSPQTVILDNLDAAAAKRYEFDSNFEDVCLPILKRASSVPEKEMFAHHSTLNLFRREEILHNN